MISSTASSARAADISVSGQALPRSSPGALGIEPSAIAGFVDAVNERVGGLHGFILMRHGQVAAEASWTPYAPQRPHVLYSLSKSFTSSAVGFVVAEGLLRVEDKVLSFFPDETPAKVSDNLAAMRVKDLLTMATGHETEPNVRTDDNWVRAFLAHPVEHAPGTHFLYNTPATHVLSAIVQKLTGQRLTEYLTPRLFEPLGIRNPVWERSPLGIDIGGYGLSLTTEDIARFGQLYLQKGQWNGKQLLPESWVSEATSAQVSNGDPATGGEWNQGYGYQFWRSKHGNYRGDGAFGQFCLVMPKHDAVLAITSGVSDMGAVMDAAWTHLLPGMSDHPISDDGTGALRDKLASQEVAPPSGSRTSPLAQRVSGATWRLDANDDKIESVRLDFEPDRCLLTRTAPGGSQTLAVGLDTWIEGPAPWGDEARPAAARGAWIDDATFQIKVCYVNAPNVWSETVRFAGDQITIDNRKMNVSFGDPNRPSLAGQRVNA